MVSTSIFTLSFIFKKPKVVFCKVCEIIFTLKVFSLILFTVNDTPSIDIDPLLTINFINFFGTLKSNL